MDVRMISLLINGMERLQAMEHLMNMDFSSYPHADNKTRKSEHKKWYKVAYPEAFDKKTIKTTDLELF